MPKASARLRRLRIQEQLYRAEGYFQAAVTVQREADHVEAGILSPLICSVADRGAAIGPGVYVQDGVFVVTSSDGVSAVALTEDRAVMLWAALIVYLEITPQELRQVALQANEDAR